MERWKGCTQRVRLAAGALLLCGLAGCTTRPAETPDEKLQHQAAQDAQQLHHDLKDAGKEASAALVAARRETKDVVAGAKQGWNEGGGKPGSREAATGADPGRDGDTVDVNHASVRVLETLPGIHAETARKIVAGRPYADRAELEKRGILSHAEYAHIASQLSAE